MHLLMIVNYCTCTCNSTTIYSLNASTIVMNVFRSLQSSCNTLWLIPFVFYLEYLMDAMEQLETNQTSDTMKIVVGNAVANITNQMVYGRRLEYSDPNMESLTSFDGYYMTAFKAALIPGYIFFSKVRVYKILTIVIISLIFVSLE